MSKAKDYGIDAEGKQALFAGRSIKVWQLTHRFHAAEDHGFLPAKTSKILLTIS